MLAWLRSWLAAGHVASGLDGLLGERRRLDELMTSYRNFGFQALIPDCKRRRAALERKIQKLQSA